LSGWSRSYRCVVRAQRTGQVRPGGRQGPASHQRRLKLHWVQSADLEGTGTSVSLAPTSGKGLPVWTTCVRKARQTQVRIERWRC
jgi:hypothetical protein